MDIDGTKTAILEMARSLPLEAAREVVAALQDDLQSRENKRMNEVLVEIRRLAKVNKLDVDIRRKRGRPRKAAKP